MLKDWDISITADGLTIRQPTDSDLKAVAGMIHELAELHGHFASVGVSDLRRDLLSDSPKAWSFVALDHGTPAGLIIFFGVYDATSGTQGIEISHLFVGEEFRRRKIGMRLTDLVLKNAKKLGYGFSSLKVRHWNQVARDFYLSSGFYCYDEKEYINTEYYHDLGLFREEID